MRLTERGERRGETARRPKRGPQVVVRGGVVRVQFHRAFVRRDRVIVSTGEYREQLVFPRNGTEQARIELIAGDGQTPILEGTGFSGGNMVLMENRSFVTIDGFEIRNLSNINDGSGVRVLGSGQGVQIRNNRIHNLRGNDAMGITVYGTQAEAIRDIVISGNQIYDCDPARFPTRVSGCA